MKFNSWQFLTILSAILLGLFIASSTAQVFTTPQWPPVTDGEIEFDFTTPPWPPATETDEVVTQPGETTQPPSTGSTTAPGGSNNNDLAEDNTAWMVTAIVFIVLAVFFAILAIYLYVSFPKRPLRPGRTFVLPRVNP